MFLFNFVSSLKFILLTSKKVTKETNVTNKFLVVQPICLIFSSNNLGNQIIKIMKKIDKKLLTTITLLVSAGWFSEQQFDL